MNQPFHSIETDWRNYGIFKFLFKFHRFCFIILAIELKDREDELFENVQRHLLCYSIGCGNR